MAKNDDEAAAKAKAEEAKAKADAEAEAAKAKAKDEAPAKAEKRPPYYIADGKAVVCNRGSLGPGEEITARDLNENEAAGKKQLEYLVSRGLVVKSG